MPASATAAPSHATGHRPALADAAQARAKARELVERLRARASKVDVERRIADTWVECGRSYACAGFASNGVVDSGPPRTTN